MYVCILFYPGRPDVQGLDWAISRSLPLSTGDESARIG